MHAFDYKVSKRKKVEYITLFFETQKLKKKKGNIQVEVLSINFMILSVFIIIVVI